jgi:hypothetical protein
MSEYTITVDGYESGLTANAVEAQFNEQYPDSNITVTESDN